MGQDIARIRGLEIEYLGFYERGGKVCALGTSTKGILAKLCDWVDGKNVEDTLLATSDTNVGVYCAYAAELGGTYLVCLWNEMPDHEGVTPSIERKGKVGKAKLQTAKKNKNVINGFPSYFWYIPTSDLLLNVKYRLSYGDKGDLQNYLSSYLSYSPWAKEDPNGELIGYGSLGTKDVNDELNPRVKISLAKEKSYRTYVRQKRARIKKIYYKTRRREFQHVTKVERSVKGLLKVLGVNREDLGLKDRKDFFMQVELNFTPTEDELSEMFSRFDEGDGDINIGFKIENDKDALGVRWLDRNRTHAEVELDVEIEGITPKSSSLHSELNRVKSKVLGQLS